MNEVFDPLCYYAPGIHLVEASAGTGKTYSITNLVIRLVAREDVRLREILVVTFTRAATAELRDRIHTRLGLAIRTIEGTGWDETLGPWCNDLSEEDKTEARRRLQRARLEIDTAPILTIHGFCQRALDAHAFESGTELGLELTPDTSDIYDSVVHDEMAERLFSAPRASVAMLREAGVTLDGMRSYARAFLGEPALEVLPTPDESAIERWLELTRTLAEDRRWIDDVARVLQEASAAGHLNRQSYKAQQIDKAVVELRDWVERGTPPGAGAVQTLKRFRLSELKKKTKKGQPTPEHRFFEEADTLADEAMRPVVAIRASIAKSLRSRYRRALVRDGVRTYQELIDALRDGVLDPGRGEELVRSLRSQYRVALIDEFQDTDSAQWEVFRTVFDDGNRRLFLIGDPKQSVYRFRGANIHTYTEAKRQAGSSNTYTMNRNYRSDDVVIDGVRALMGFDGAFRDPDLHYIDVEAVERTPSRRIQRGQGDPLPPLTVRWWDPATVGVEADTLSKSEMAERLPSLVAAQISRELGTVDGEPYIRLHADDSSWRPLSPADVAVLVNTNDQAMRVQQELVELGVPAVIAARQSVYTSDEAEHLARWIHALAHPRDAGALRGLLATPLGGWTAKELDEVSDDKWDVWSLRLAYWRKMAIERGVLAAFRRTLSDLRAEARLIEEKGGRRRLTNYRHLAELVHEVASQERLGMRALAARLMQLRNEPPKDDDDALVRLEMDDEAVTVVTVHRSKGLEYPVVHVPFASENRGVERRSALVGADPANPTRRVIRVDADTDSKEAVAFFEQLERDASAEDMRKLYVALTRAEHALTLWLGPVKRRWDIGFTTASPAGHVLLRGRAVKKGDEIRNAAKQTVDNDSALHWCDTLPSARPYRRHAREDRELHPAVWTRDVKWQSWGVGSFSSFVTGQKALDRPDAHAVEPDAEGRETEDGPELVALEDRAIRTLERFPAGRRPGTCLHAVYEFAPFAGARRDASDEDRMAFETTVVRVLNEHGFDGTDWKDKGFVDDLAEVLRAPLGGPIGNTCLADVPKEDRIAELRFDLPVLGGRDHKAGTWLRSTELQEIIRAREGFPYSELATPLESREVAGFLTGIIDLVFRAQTPTGEKWFVADYKSNRFDGDDPATTYTADAIGIDAAGHHYPLQAHIYLLALHRLLRVRLGESYDYDTHIGGTYLLYLRGMIARGNPQPGVLFDRPPRETIEALDELFSRGTT